VYQCCLESLPPRVTTPSSPESSKGGKKIVDLIPTDPGGFLEISLRGREKREVI